MLLVHHRRRRFLKIQLLFSGIPLPVRKIYYEFGNPVNELKEANPKHIPA
jgi:hypothetical protein